MTRKDDSQMNHNQQMFVRAAGEALFGKDEKWFAPLARAMGDNVYERQLRRALADEPMATLMDKDFYRLRNLLKQRQVAIAYALKRFDRLEMPETRASKAA
jgi:hypothetical protein